MPIFSVRMGFRVLTVLAFFFEPGATRGWGGDLMSGPRQSECGLATTSTLGDGKCVLGEALSNTTVNMVMGFYGLLDSVTAVWVR